MVGSAARTLVKLVPRRAMLSAKPVTGCIFLICNSYAFIPD
jgi:hypothetical protein